MDQTTTKRHFLKSIVPILLITALFLSWISPLSARADTPVFSGIADAQAEEGQPFDLLSDVSAVDTDGQAMIVTVSQVTSEGNPIATPDAVLTMGAAGTRYLVEYSATSGGESSETHTAQRTVVSVSASDTDTTVSAPTPNEGVADPDSSQTDTAPEAPQSDNTVQPAVPDANLPDSESNQPAAPDVDSPSTDPMLPSSGDGSASSDAESELPAVDDEIVSDEVQTPNTDAPDSDTTIEDSTDDTATQDAENTAESGELMTQTGLPIRFENGLHYVTDPQYPDDPMILYCMNNKLAWPHYTEQHPNVPNYTEGYLTPDDFDSQAQYDEFMGKLRKILFAGFPYNSERLYKLVPTGSLHTPTDQEFNNMLTLPPQLSSDFPYLTHHKYVLNDVNNPKHYEELRQFVESVAQLNPDKTTEHGLSYNDITSMPFYKAAFSMTFNGMGATTSAAKETFANMYSASYFVTQEQAYDATNLAIWKLMYDYGIEHNNISSLDNSQLAETLYQYCQHGTLLSTPPDPNQIYVEGDLSFSYDPSDGKWHSGKLKIVEPVEYNGLYHFDLPEGVTAICEDANHVYANEEYELVSATQPKDGSQFRFFATIDWLQDMKQYSPINNTEFQNMVGAIVRKTPVSQTLNYSANPEGSVEIMKVVYGNANDQQNEFHFIMELDTPISGPYGDLYFDNGVAEFTLTGGEMKVAEHLPTTAYYKITERDNKDYRVTYYNTEGTVPFNNSTRVIIENTKLNSLSISKTVQGEMGDKTMPFHFDITLETADGTPANKSYPCTISSVSGTAQPSEETVVFTDGKATVALTHDQKIQINELPYGSKYTVTEQEANQDGYSTTYTATSGVLEESAEIQVVNRKEMVPPTGINDSGMGGMMVGIGLAAIGLTLPLFYGVVRRKRG